jgi:hypothetical protein
LSDAAAAMTAGMDRTCLEDMIVSVMPDLSEEKVMTVTDKLLELGVKFSQT